MPFNSDTAREAGKKSKRGKARLGQELKERLEQLSNELIESIKIEELAVTELDYLNNLLLYSTKIQGYCSSKSSRRPKDITIHS